MRTAFALALLVAFGTTGALAMDDSVSPVDLEKVKAAIKDLGCESMEEVETEGLGYEIDDAKCKMGVVDIKLDKDFRVVVISRD